MKALDINDVNNVNNIELNVNKINNKDVKTTKRHFKVIFVVNFEQIRCNIKHINLLFSFITLICL